MSVDPSTMPFKCTLFCDESGNSGGNLVDPNQPVYVLEGWLVPDGATSGLDEALGEFKLRACPDAPEVHGVRVLKTSRGRRHLPMFLDAAAQAGALPVYQVVEKRYWIAGKVVETFLDPYYNAESNWGFYNDIEAKQEVADFISSMPADLLGEFGRSYRELDLSGLARAATRFSGLLGLGPRSELGPAILGAIPALPDIIAAERSANDSQPNNAMQSINLPTLLSFASDAEHAARQLGIDELRLVHDESPEFEAAYNWWISAHSRLDPGGEIRLPNEHVLATAFTRVKGLSMARSVDSPAIQAADLLVSAVQLFARAISERAVPEGWLLKPLEPVMRLIVIRLFEGGPHLGRFLGSPSFNVGLVRHLPSINPNAGSEATSERTP